MGNKTEAEKQRQGLPLLYTHTIHIRRRDEAHYLALCRHTTLSPEELLRVALCDGLARGAKNRCKQDDINALDQLLQWKEEADQQAKETTS